MSTIEPSTWCAAAPWPWPLRHRSRSADLTVVVARQEPLPPSSDHDAVRALLAPYGTVLYVSLPRYRSSGDIKGAWSGPAGRPVRPPWRRLTSGYAGFAFVEFARAEEAQRAVAAHPQSDTADALRIMSKHDWLHMKAAYKQLLKQAADADPSLKPARRRRSRPAPAPRPPRSTGCLVAVDGIDPAATYAALRVRAARCRRWRCAGSARSGRGVERRQTRFPTAAYIDHEIGGTKVR